MEVLRYRTETPVLGRNFKDHEIQFCWEEISQLNAGVNLGEALVRQLENEKADAKRSFEQAYEMTRSLTDENTQLVEERDQWKAEAENALETLRHLRATIPPAFQQPNPRAGNGFCGLLRWSKRRGA